MSDRKARCTNCDKRVWVLANDDGKYRWERHTDKAGKTCPNSGQVTRKP